MSEDDGAVATVRLPKVSAPRAGVPLIVGAAVAVVGTFLPYEKLETGIGSYSFTGVGSETVTGAILAKDFTPSNVGIAVLVLSLVALLLGLLVLIGKGRTWVSIATLGLAGVALAASLTAMTAASRDATKFGKARNIDFVGSVGIGAVLGAVGTGVAVVASVVAFVARRRRN